MPHNPRIKNQVASSKKPGFGLIETLIASGIIALIAGAVASLSISISKSTGQINQRIIANNLATQAIEIAHFVRDKNLLDNNPATLWNNGMLQIGSGCIDRTNDNNACGVNPDTTPTADTPYTFNLGADTITIQGDSYTRKIYFYSPTPSETDTDNALTMEVKIFRGTDTTALADVSTALTNWREL